MSHIFCSKRPNTHSLPPPEQGSTTHTLTGTQTLTLPRFSRLEESQSIASDGDASALSIVKTPSLPPRPSPSRLTRFVAKFLTCIGPSNAHPPDPDDSLTAISDLKSNIALREMPSPSDPGTLRPPGLPNNTPSTSSPSGDIDLVVVPPSAKLLPQSETDGLTSGAVQPPGSTGTPVVARARTRDPADETDDTNTDDDGDHGEADDDEERLIRNGGAGIPIGPVCPPFLCSMPISDLYSLSGRYTSPAAASHRPSPSWAKMPRPRSRRDARPQQFQSEFLSLSSYFSRCLTQMQAVQQADFIVPVEIESHWHHFHVLKRPGVDNFLRAMGDLFEVVVYTASLSKVRVGTDLHSIIQ